MLVGVELLFEEGDLAACILLSQITQLSLMLVLKLGLLVSEVLLLRLYDYVKLSLLALDLLDELLQVGDLLEVLDLLTGDLLVEHVLLFLVSDLILELTLSDQGDFRIKIVALSLTMHVGVSLGCVCWAWASVQEGRSNLSSAADTRSERHYVSILHMRALFISIRDTVAVFKMVQVVI